MTALFWQALIATSIVAAFYISYISRKRQKTLSSKIRSNAALLTIIGWTLWTLVVLSGPLMNFQIALILVVAAISVFVVRSIKSRDQKVSNLEAALADAEDIQNPNFDEAILREQAKEDAEANFVSKIYPIDGVQNLKSEMYSAIKKLNIPNLIMSGCI